jgi:imidazolonepropionase-like amidohydrolase
VDEIERAQKRIGTSTARAADGTDCGRSRLDHGILEVQVLVAAGLPPLRALKAGKSVVANLLQRDDNGVLARGKQADIVAMIGNSIADIGATEHVDVVMTRVCIYRHQALDVFQL